MSAIKFAFRFGSVLFNASSFTLPPVLVRTADQKKTHTHTHMHTQMKRDLIRPWNTSSTFSLLQTGTMPRQLLACHHCLCRSASRVYSCHDSPVLFVLYARTCACVFACGCTSSFLRINHHHLNLAFSFQMIYCLNNTISEQNQIF